MKKVTTILRWLAVLPGSFLFALLCDFPIHWFVVMQKYVPDKIIEFGNPAQLEYLMYAFFNPLTMILAVAYIAPQKKFIASVIASVLMIIFITFSYYFAITNEVSIGSMDILLKSTLNIAGLTLALIYAYRKNLALELSTCTKPKCD